MLPLETIIVITSISIFSVGFLFYERSRYPKKIREIGVAIKNEEYLEALNGLEKIGIKLEYLTTIYLYYIDIYFNQENWHSALYYIYLIEKTEICREQLEDEHSFLLKKIKILENIKRYDEAIETYEKVMVTHVNSEISFSYAMLLYNIHRYSEALESFKFCYRENYRKEKTLSLIIIICFKSSLFKEGIEYYQENKQTSINNIFIYGSLCYYFFGDYYQVTQNLKSLNNDSFDVNEENGLTFLCLKTFNEYQLSINKLKFYENFKNLITKIDNSTVDEVVDLEARYCFLDILLTKRDEMVIVFKQMQYIVKKDSNYKKISEIFRKFNKIIKNPLFKKIYVDSDINYSIEEIETLLIQIGIKNFSSSIISNNLLLITIRYNRIFSLVIYLGHNQINKKELDTLIDTIEGEKFYLFSIWGVSSLITSSLEYTDVEMINITEEQFLSLEKGVNIFETN